jgi:hypothetical protein
MAKTRGGGRKRSNMLFRMFRRTAKVLPKPNSRSSSGSSSSSNKKKYTVRYKPQNTQNPIAEQPFTKIAPF